MCVCADSIKRACVIYQVCVSRSYKVCLTVLSSAGVPVLLSAVHAHKVQHQEAFKRSTLLASNTRALFQSHQANVSYHHRKPKNEDPSEISHFFHVSYEK